MRFFKPFVPIISDSDSSEEDSPAEKTKILISKPKPQEPAFSTGTESSDDTDHLPNEPSTSRSRKNGEKKKEVNRTRGFFLQQSEKTEPEQQNEDPEMPLKKFERKQINREFVMKPSAKIEGDTPQRPFPREFYSFDRKAVGSAREIFDMIFSDKKSKTPWLTGNFTAPIDYIQNLQMKRQEQLRNYPMPTIDELRLRRKQKVLESLRELLWILHFHRSDPHIENVCGMMLKTFICRFDSKNQIKFAGYHDLSFIWNQHLTEKKVFALSQRKAGWMLRPVFIDGSPIFYTLFGDDIGKWPKMFPVRLLIEILVHFILDGHQTTLFLGDTVAKQIRDTVDDLDVLNILLHRSLVVKKNMKGRSTRYALERAEESHGIFVSAGTEAKTSDAIHCYPAIHRNPQCNDDFQISTVFVRKANLIEKFLGEVGRSDRRMFTKMTGMSDFSVNPQDSDGSEENTEFPEDSGVDTEKFQSQNVSWESDFSDGDSLGSEDLDSSDPGCISYHDFSKRCRIYLHSENENLDTNQYQLTLMEQLSLIAAFSHSTTFDYERRCQIRALLKLINRFAPELLPFTLKKSVLEKVEKAMAEIREKKSPTLWPVVNIFRL